MTYPTLPLFPEDPPSPAGAQSIGVAGASRRSDPETSKEAADSINAASLEGQVYRDLLAHGPSILDEVMTRTKMDKVTCSPRFARLEAKGYAELTGVKRPGKAGRNQQEWRAIPGKELTTE